MNLQPSFRHQSWSVCVSTERHSSTPPGLSRMFWISGVCCKHIHSTAGISRWYFISLLQGKPLTLWRLEGGKPKKSEASFPRRCFPRSRLSEDAHPRPAWRSDSGGGAGMLRFTACFCHLVDTRDGRTLLSSAGHDFFPTAVPVFSNGTRGVCVLLVHRLWSERASRPGAHEVIALAQLIS